MLDDKKQTAKEIKQEVEKTAQQAIQALKRIAKIIKGTVVAIKNPITWIIAGIIILVIALIGMTQVLGKNEVGHVCVYTDDKGQTVQVDEEKAKKEAEAENKKYATSSAKPTHKDKDKCERIGWGKKTGTTGSVANDDATANGGGEFGTVSAWNDNKSDFGKPDMSHSGYKNGMMFGQCTWYAYGRRAELGKTMPTQAMGNGGDWGNTAMRLGMDVDHTPKAGDAVSFPPGVSGADKTYGHVAVVEKVLDNGDFVVSESNVGGYPTGTVTMRTIPASSAQYAWFIH